MGAETALSLGTVAGAGVPDAARAAAGPSGRADCADCPNGGACPQRAAGIAACGGSGESGGIGRVGMAGMAGVAGVAGVGAGADMVVGAGETVGGASRIGGTSGRGGNDPNSGMEETDGTGEKDGTARAGFARTEDLAGEAPRAEATGDRAEGTRSGRTEGMAGESSFAGTTSAVRAEPFKAFTDAAGRDRARDAVIVTILRTPVGKAKKGSLAQTRADDLGRIVLEAAIERTPGLAKGDVEDVIVGCAMPEGEQGLNFARIMSLYAGYPNAVPALTVNRFCASGLQAIAFAAERIRLGDADVIVAGGVESMSHVPMSGFKLSPNPRIVETMPEVYIGMGHTAENVAERFGVSREDQDRFALRSHEKAARAIAEGRFDDELVAVRGESRGLDERGRAYAKPFEFRMDEGVRTDTTAEALAKLKPAFKANGTVTAGNSSQMSDGAAAAVVMSRDRAEALGLRPLAALRSYALAGVEPELMGVGPVKAIPKALAKAGIGLGDVKLFEINEAFASQCLQIIRELGIDEEKVNVNGGAIALGHPLGCTGAKLSATLIHELRRRGGGFGVVSMCIGGGMGAAGVFEVFGE